MTKKILVTLPLSDEQKVFLESRPEGGIPCTFVYKPDNEVTAEDLKDTQVVIGCIPPALYKSAPQIEWVQLHSAVGMYSDECFRRVWPCCFRAYAGHDL